MGYGPYEFLMPELNNRTDQYGGNTQNRVRLLREIVEETKAAIGDTCAVAVRFSSDALLRLPGRSLPSEAHEIVALLADVPDLWDVKSSDWTVETASARFSGEGAQEPFNRFVKPLTSKPVVGVGRFTSPDEMVRQVRSGILDLIGAARPSIADPFLPKKIGEGREDEIRECIGCNICVSAYHDGVPVRCTQNPTMGEEWRRGWHPERIPPGDPGKRVLIVGAGPAGLECARAMGQRGFRVTLAEARKELGGRVTLESALPGLATWARVRDYRTHHLQTMANVDIYRDSLLTAADVHDFGGDHAVVATGASWTRKILGAKGYPTDELVGDAVYTPDDILVGAALDSPVVVYDFDHYYMGSCLAELLRTQGHEVMIVTPANAVSAWTFMNNELRFIRERMIERGIGIVLEQLVTGFGDGELQLTPVHRGDETAPRECGSLVVVGTRVPNDDLFRQLTADARRTADAGIESVRSIGDCRAPGAIVHAVYSGHECARTIDDREPRLVSWERARSSASSASVGA